MSRLRMQIDGQTVEAERGETILDAARKAGIEIPSLCHWPGCTPQTSCMACVVRVEGSRRLLPSCAVEAADGMVVHSSAPDVQEARRTALELLLADHAGDCMARCQTTCPAHMDIPRMLRQIRAGELHDALMTVKQKIALPAVLGRICPELCEKGCRRQAVDESVSVCRLKRFVADVDLAQERPWLPARLASTGRRVAIVGAGPTGLAAAWYLLQLGHDCTLFDRAARPGGALRTGPSEAVLPRDVLDAEIDLVGELGARFVTGATIDDERLQKLHAEYHAVLLAAGRLDGQAFAAELRSGEGIAVDRLTMMTRQAGIFAAGAVVTPMRHAVRAVADGRSAAFAIDAWLAGIAPPRRGAGFTVRLGTLNQAELAALAHGADPRPRVTAADHASVCDDQAVAEASRCLSCACAALENCRLRDASAALDATPKTYDLPRRPFERVVTHPRIVYEPGKCIGCGLCVQIAQRSCEPLGLSFIGRGFGMRIGVPWNEPLADALTAAADECASACPTGAIVLRDPIRAAPIPVAGSVPPWCG